MPTSIRHDIKRNKNLIDTKTSKFLLPMLDMNPSYYTRFFIDMYIIDDETNPKLVSTFDNEDEESLLMHFYKLSNHHSFVENGNDDNDNELYVINQIPKIYLDDYFKFKEGKYSKFSEGYKKNLVKTYGKVTSTGMKESGVPGVLMYDIIYPDEKFEGSKRSKREQFAISLGVDVKYVEEVYEKPNLDYEKYITTQEYKEKYGN